MVPDDGQLPAKQFGRARKIGRLYRATSRPLPLDTRSRSEDAFLFLPPPLCETIIWIIGEGDASSIDSGN